MDLVDLIEKHTTDAIDQVTEEIFEALALPDYGVAEARALLQPYIRLCAEALATSLTTGESAEQFDERLAALKIERSE